MRRFNIKLSILFIFLMSLCFSASALDLSAIPIPKLNDVKIPEVTKVQLDNGLRVYLVEDHSLPIIDITARIAGGEYMEPADRVGVIGVMGMLLRDGGTSKWSPDELDELLEGKGASLSSYADVIACYVEEQMLSNEPELSVELLAEVMRRPRFDYKRFDQAMISVKSSIARRNDNDSRIANREFKKLIYGSNSVYARHPEYKTIEGLTADELVKYYDMIFKPEHVQIALCGDFKADEMAELIKKYFSDWKKGSTVLPEYPKVDYKYENKVFFVNRPGAKQSNVYLGHIGGNLRDADNPHRIVMNNLLGDGFGSRLFKEVRSKHGLCYSVFGVYTANISFPGMFICYVGTKGESTIQAIKLIKKELEKLQNTLPTEEEVKSAKDRYLNNFVFNFETKNQIVSRMLTYDFFGLPADFLNKEKESVENTTAADIQNAAKKYLHPDSLKIIVVGDPNNFGGSLEELEAGKPVELDISIIEE